MADKNKAAKARVIADHGDHRIDDIVSGAQAEAGIEAGWADGAPGAIAYAEKQARLRDRNADADADADAE